MLYEHRETVNELRRHTVAVLVDNEPGVLARVIGLFSGRGYNIDSLTVAEVDQAAHLSRITIVTTGTEQIIEQIKALLGKQVPVRQLADLTVEGDVIERELALAKVTGDRGRLIDALRVADFMGARLIDRTIDTLTFEVTGSSEDIDSFLTLLEPVEVSRAGVVAMARGPRTLSPAA
ncbi:MAG: acetolactate synthase small subunit [Pseudomonadota bacterium]